MFIELTFAIFVGIFCGIITGLTPGIHVNLISLILLSLSAILLNFFSPLFIATIIIAMAVTHSFLDALPSIYLGAPDTDMVLSILPGHKMLLEGNGHGAVMLTVIGSLLALLLSIIISPLLFFTIKFVFPIISNYIVYMLIAIITYMILKDKNRMLNLFLFTTSGVFGLIVLNTYSLKNPLFPMLSGLFGISTLLISLSQKVNIPEQSKSDKQDIEMSRVTKAIAGSTIAGSCTAFFPGLGPAQGAVLATQLIKDIGDKGFLVLTGGINTVNFIMSLITLHVLSKARNGAVVVVQQIIESTRIVDLALLFIVVLLAGCAATLLALKLSRFFSTAITKVNYKLLCISIICFITILVFYFSGFIGLIVLIVSTLIGLLAPLMNIARNHSMGCLLLPVILVMV